MYMHVHIIDEKYLQLLKASYVSCNFRGLIQEYASKVWVTYFENERKCQSTYAERLPTQIQSASSQFTSLSAYVICLYDPYLNNRKAVLA